ncbi:FAD-dependent oxidoreductase [Paenibacillus allorhizosphaerae]|uniref:FAD-dependent oxidoreductase n=1 Tax=Paenibacillus allorhizosphaerae TaxID=2849866 RepID=UPI001C406685|nr:FAD-dependent oxidoreductase [Paenibacillus allorhizosphaerae]
MGNPHISRKGRIYDGGIRKKIVIVGGGISGLSTAFYMRKLVEKLQIPADITLVEKNGQLGGKVTKR